MEKLKMMRMMTMTKSINMIKTTKPAEMNMTTMDVLTTNIMNIMKMLKKYDNDVIKELMNMKLYKIMLSTKLYIISLDGITGPG